MEKLYIVVIDHNSITVNNYIFDYVENADLQESEAVEIYIISEGHRLSECSWMYHTAPIEIVNPPVATAENKVHQIILKIEKKQNDVGDYRWYVTGNNVHIDFFFDEPSAIQFFQRYKATLLQPKESELVLTETITLNQDGKK